MSVDHIKQLTNRELISYRSELEDATRTLPKSSPVYESMKSELADVLHEQGVRGSFVAASIVGPDTGPFLITRHVPRLGFP